MSNVKLTQVRSLIGRNKRQRATLDSLGLRKIGQTKVHKLTPQISGMIEKVKFLLKVEENV